MVCRLARFAPVVALALASWVARDASAGDTLRLDWSAPAVCPTALQVHSAALRGAESEPSETAASERDGNEGTLSAPVLEASATVSSFDRDGVAHWTVQLHTRRGSVTGERVIEASSCDGVAEATAVVLALALLSSSPTGEESVVSEATTSKALVPGAVAPDPVAAHAVVSQAKVPQKAAARTPPPRSSRVRGARRASLAQTLTRARVVPAGSFPAGALEHEPRSTELVVQDLSLGVSAAGDSATLPSPAIGASFTLSWRLGRGLLEADVRTWAAQTHTLDFWAAGARFSRLSVGARGCWTLWRSQGGGGDVAACGGADIERVRAPGRGVDPSYDASADWVAGAAGGLGRIVLTRWLALRTRLEGSVPLSRPRFVIDGAGSLHRPAALSAAGSFGLELSFL
jgi:hypothetical protein